MHHVSSVRHLVVQLLKRSKAGRSLIATAETEFQKVLQTLSEAAHGRFIKLLGSRYAPLSLTCSHIRLDLILDCLSLPCLKGFALSGLVRIKFSSKCAFHVAAATITVNFFMFTNK